MLDSAIKDQLKGLFAQLEAHYTFDIFVHPQHESRAELVVQELPGIHALRADNRDIQA